MKIKYEITLKSYEEFCETTEAINDYLERNNIRYELSENCETKSLVDQT